MVGDVTENLDGTYTFRNPVIAIPQRETMAFLPFLGLMEEKTVTLRKEDIHYNSLFTPTIDLRNHYNKMFGSGIIEASANALTL